MSEQYDLAPEDPKPASGAAKGRLDGPSLTDAAAAEPCPRCGQALAADAVVCVRCGYDLRANVARETERGVEHSEDRGELPEFVTPGRGESQTLAVLGGVLLLAAVVCGLIFMPKGTSAGAMAANALLTLLQGLMHTATGGLAVAATAWLLRHRLGRVDLAAARVFVAFSAFLLALSIPIPLEYGLGLALSWLAGLLAYWLITMILFRKGPQDAAMVAGFHLLLFLLVHAAVWLESSLRASLAVSQAAMGGAGGGGGGAGGG